MTASAVRESCNVLALRLRPPVPAAARWAQRRIAKVRVRPPPQVCHNRCRGPRAGKVRNQLVDLGLRHVDLRYPFW